MDEVQRLFEVAEEMEAMGASHEESSKAYYDAEDEFFKREAWADVADIDMQYELFQAQ